MTAVRSLIDHSSVTLSDMIDDCCVELIDHSCVTLSDMIDDCCVELDQGCRFSVIFCYFWPNPFSADPFSIFSIFSYFIFLFLNFLPLFVFIFCETAPTCRFSVFFAKVQWHPCLIDHSCVTMSDMIDDWCVTMSDMIDDCCVELD